jgi:HEPN domain-containing protein
MDFLKQKSAAFFRGAERYFEDKEYGLAAFSVEQAVQLLLKDFLRAHLGEFTRTHKPTILFDDCSKLCPNLARLYDSSITLISSIEDAYIMARYFEKDYDEKEISKMLQFYRDLGKELDECE